MKLTTHLQLVPRSTKRDSLDPVAHVSSWRSACLVRQRDNFFIEIMDSIHLFKRDVSETGFCLRLQGPETG
jgi:hypothetical protein